MENTKSPKWPDSAIYWTLDNFLKPLATINLPRSPTFLGNFCKGVKIYHFSSEIILGNFYRHFVIFSGHTERDQHSYCTFKFDPSRFSRIVQTKIEKLLKRFFFSLESCVKWGSVACLLQCAHKFRQILYISTRQ